MTKGCGGGGDGDGGGGGEGGCGGNKENANGGGGGLGDGGSDGGALTGVMGGGGGKGKTPGAHQPPKTLGRHLPPNVHDWRQSIAPKGCFHLPTHSGERGSHFTRPPQRLWGCGFLWDHGCSAAQRTTGRAVKLFPPLPLSRRT